jgi:hypothetical protein
LRFGRGMAPVRGFKTRNGAADGPARDTKGTQVS